MDGVSTPPLPHHDMPLIGPLYITLPFDKLTANNIIYTMHRPNFKLGRPGVFYEALTYGMMDKEIDYVSD